VSPSARRVWVAALESALGRAAQPTGRRAARGPPSGNLTSRPHSLAAAGGCHGLTHIVRAVLRITGSRACRLTGRDRRQSELVGYPQ
jgi:hypothetical protein